jgi:hypothetical protein
MAWGNRGSQVHQLLQSFFFILSKHLKERYSLTNSYLALTLIQSVAGRCDTKGDKTNQQNNNGNVDYSVSPGLLFVHIDRSFKLEKSLQSHS